MPSDATEVRLLDATDFPVLDHVEADVFDYRRALYNSLAGTEDEDRAVVYTWQLSSKSAGAR